jgi:hypothetical protein
MVALFAIEAKQTARVTADIDILGACSSSASSSRPRRRTAQAV